ncbi:MAG: hypothetical protein M1838_002705 [Thelocarpon superellum]|nr:MAG: hypothetical protein M1838_002705 [Thelocarpon superellum]
MFLRRRKRRSAAPGAGDAPPAYPELGDKGDRDVPQEADGAGITKRGPAELVDDKGGASAPNQPEMDSTALAEAGSAEPVAKQPAVEGARPHIEADSGAIVEADAAPFNPSQAYELQADPISTPSAAPAAPATAPAQLRSFPPDNDGVSAELAAAQHRTAGDASGGDAETIAQELQQIKEERARIERERVLAKREKELQERLQAAKKDPAS